MALWLANLVRDVVVGSSCSSMLATPLLSSALYPYLVKGRPIRPSLPDPEDSL